MLFTDSHGENGKIDSSDSHHEDSPDSTDEIGSEAHQQREDRAAEQTHDHKSADLILTLRLMKHGLGENDGENDGETVNEYADLNKTQRRVYEEIKKGPTAPAEDIAKSLGVSRPTIERAISVLKKKGYIIRDGGAKGGKWTPQK